MSEKEKVRIKFEGMVLEPINRREFETENDVFKLSRWTKEYIIPFEWYFRRVKEKKEVKNE